mmetsp:Transcript_20174/g.43954  ORF Transcript_20174/g.43954 Transcript_20174/m.43954 type:complete len:200 (+) Transcript_20174:67-666(+)
MHRQCQRSSRQRHTMLSALLQLPSMHLSHCCVSTSRCSTLRHWQVHWPSHITMSSSSSSQDLQDMAAVATHSSHLLLCSCHSSSSSSSSRHMHSTSMCTPVARKQEAGRRVPAPTATRCMAVMQRLRLQACSITTMHQGLHLSRLRRSAVDPAIAVVQISPLPPPPCVACTTMLLLLPPMPLCWSTWVSLLHGPRRRGK